MDIIFCFLGESSSEGESDADAEAPKGYTDDNSSWLKLATGKGKQKLMVIMRIYEPRCEKTGLRGFRPCPTQIYVVDHAH